jgi:1,4-dihydroxy-2-naphthoate octaprenyltransferase
MACAAAFTLIDFRSPWQFIYLISFPLFIRNGLAVSRITESSQLDPYLKQLALSTLLFVLTFGLGLLIV